MAEHQYAQQPKKTDAITQKQTNPTQTAPKTQLPSSHPAAIIQRARINPKSLTHADVMQLQRTIGNRAVGKLLSEIGLIPSTVKPVQKQEISEEETCPSCVQRQEIPEEEEPLQGKMIKTIQRKEILEEEAPLQRKMIETIQRQEIPEEEELLQGKFEGDPEQETCSSCVQRQEIPEEEEPLQGKMADTVQCQEILEEEEPLQRKMIGTIQRQEIPEEEEPLQGKVAETIQRQEIPEEEEPLQTQRENNTGMPDNLKAGVENLSGIDMSDVRVHYNSNKPAEVGALAYTQGMDIHVAPGQEKHVPHETWHVVQQAQGRVKPTMQLKDVAVNDDKGLESEADLMGAEAAVGSQLLTSSWSSHNRLCSTKAIQIPSALSHSEKSIQMEECLTCGYDKGNKIKCPNCAGIEQNLQRLRRAGVNPSDRKHIRCVSPSGIRPHPQSEQNRMMGVTKTREGTFIISFSGPAGGMSNGDRLIQSEQGSNRRQELRLFRGGKTRMHERYSTYNCCEGSGVAIAGRLGLHPTQVAAYHSINGKRGPCQNCQEWVNEDGSYKGKSPIIHPDERNRSRSPSRHEHRHHHDERSRSRSPSRHGYGHRHDRDERSRSRSPSRHGYGHRHDRDERSRSRSPSRHQGR